MQKKVTIIGAGSVGSTIAYTLTVMGLATEIVLIDINDEKAKGEALDIRQGTPFCGASTIYAGSYPDARNSDIVILTSGLARKPGQTRLELAQTNVNITKSITLDLNGCSISGNLTANRCQILDSQTADYTVLK